MAEFIVRVLIYLICFILSFTGMSAVDFERFLKKGHVREAQILYWLMVLALATLAAQFVMAFLYF